MKNTLFSPRRWPILIALLACALFIAAPAQADPAARVGRIAWLSGSGAVNLSNPNSSESFSAPLNQPLTSGDILTTATNSRAEIQIGSMTVRLDSGSVLELDRIDDEQVHLFLNDGRVIVNLPSPDAVRDFVLETRNGRFSARHTGLYRFDAEASSSSATAYLGALHFEASDSALDIGAGQRAQFWNDGQTRSRLSAAANDDFAQWSSTRDRRPTANTYSRYVSPEMTGAEDLDAYGNWSDNAEYGAIWYPRAVAADWAPYRNGHWVWVAPWGWNWVAYEPWGFAPFHFGRWVHHRGMWGWVPGTRIARPVYSPAMVAWIGTPGIGVSIAIGSRHTVGWFPLAPREVYVPSYRSSANYVRNVNFTHAPHLNNVTNIINNPQAVVQHTRYAHRQLSQAVTVVPADVVTQRRSVASAALSTRDHRALREQPLQATAPVAAPQAETRNHQDRQEHPGQAFVRREREQQAPVLATPAGTGNVTAPAPVLHAPAVAAQRSERSMPETVRPAPQSRSEPFEPRRQEVAAPVSQPQTETRVRQERPDQPFTRREREQQTPVVATPATPVNRNINVPAPVSVPQVPVVAPQRSERPMPETVRSTPQSRPEAFEPRAQDRQVRREEPAVRLPQPEMHAAPAPQQIRQAPPARVEVRAATPPPTVREARHEAPREVSRPAEPRVEARTPPQAERPRPAQNEDKQRHRRDEVEKR